MKCSVPECQDSARSRGLCIVHYNRVKRHGSTDYKKVVLDVPIGYVTGFLIVTGPAQHNEKRSRVFPTVCVCSRTRFVGAHSLLSGRAKSCGCKTLALAAGETRTHGLSKTPEWKAWTAMRERCNNPLCAEYRNYGARGIKVHADLERFIDFLAVLGPRPTPGHSLDRKENDGDYCASNVRWATRIEQQRNRRVTFRVEHNGQKRPLAEICEEVGVCREYVYRRIKAGWPVDKAIAVPKGGRP